MALLQIGGNRSEVCRQRRQGSSTYIRSSRASKTGRRSSRDSRARDVAFGRVVKRRSRGRLRYAIKAGDRRCCVLRSASWAAATWEAQRRTADAVYRSPPKGRGVLPRRREPPRHAARKSPGLEGISHPREKVSTVRRRRGDTVPRISTMRSASEKAACRVINSAC